MEALETLGIDIRIIITQVVGFLILYLILNKFLFKRVQGILKKRKEEIKATYEKNEAERQDIAKLKGEHAEKISGIQLEADRIVEEGRKEAEALKKEMIAAAEKDSKELLEKSKREIEEEKERAISEAHDQIADLSLLVASKVIKKSLSHEDHLHLVDEYIPKIGDLYKED
ncbi:MAG: F0F1 ATP synthase subunit B [Nitrospinota bacterium]